MKKLMKLRLVNLLDETVKCDQSVFHDTVYDPQIDSSCLNANDFFHVCLITEGYGVHRVSDQAIPCKAGDIYVVPPHMPHGFFLVDEADPLAVQSLCFRVEDWLEGEVASVEHPRYCYGIFHDNSLLAYALLNEQARNEIARLLSEIEEELLEKKQEWHDAVQAYLTRLLISLGRYINRSIKNSESISSKDWSLVLPVMKTVREHFGDSNCTLDNISSALYVSKSHLSRVFKSVTGQAFSDYLRDVRIENVCRLLRETNLNVDEIAEKCGLRDIHSFYRLFGARLHMTPRQYRQTVMDEQKQDWIEGSRGYFVELLNSISEHMQSGRAEPMKALIQKALDEGADPERVLEGGLLSGMSTIGEKFKNNEIYVPEVLVAARAMNQGMQMLKPYFFINDSGSVGKVCIGTVQGDLHDIGKNLVVMMMESKGLEVIDLGTDVAPEAFVQAAIQQNCRVICCSALLTTTMHVMADIVKTFEAAGIRDRVKIMVGGAPVNQEFCQQIGADCYTEDAASAAEAAVAFCRQADTDRE